MTTQSSLYSSGTYYLDGAKVKGVPIDLANVEAVEVVKGPDLVLFGRAEPGGLVNVRTRPHSRPRRLPSSLRQRENTACLARPRGQRGTRRDQHWLAAISGSYLNTGSNRDYVVEKLGTASGSLAWLPVSGTSVRFTVDYSNHRYRNDYGIPSDGNRPADVSLNTAYNDSPVLSKDETQSYRLDVTQAITVTGRSSCAVSICARYPRTRRSAISHRSYDWGGSVASSRQLPPLLQRPARRALPGRPGER